MYMLKRAHPYGRVYVIQMDFLKWQQEAIILIALFPATASGVSFLLSLFLPSLESSFVDASGKLIWIDTKPVIIMHGIKMHM